ncbi:hypothetical protein LR68_03792 [Anoxybacillus sp. BCO1]|nr:hypothetical protein LR68_03792 [Anoxybacillus sp. BCO1]
MENILELDNVCKVFQGFALQNVSFSLEKGYIMGFIGPTVQEKYYDSLYYGSRTH